MPLAQVIAAEPSRLGGKDVIEKMAKRAESEHP